MDLNLAKNAAAQAADGAKDILMHYYGRVRQVESKKGQGLVSEADKESEKFIRACLTKYFPNSDILGEEEGMSQSSGQGLWMIDPLDGTHNYICGFPFFCISIGLEWKSELVFALIDAPVLGLRFEATKGQGAFMNNKPIRVSESAGMADILVATGFSYSKGEILNKQVELFREVAHKSLGIRRAGAAALDLAFVAQGVFGGFWEKTLKPWDTAAGTLLVREAGGVVTNFKGEKYFPSMDDLVAGSPKVHSEILNHTQKSN